MRAHFTRAALTPAPTTQGHRGQEVVYTFREEMTLKAAEAIKMALDERAACMANHVHPHTGDTWHYAFPGEDGMGSIAPLPECERQGHEISALAKVAEDRVRETRGVEQGTSAVGTIWRARYRKGEWMMREDTKVIFPVATKVSAAAQWAGQAVHILLPDDRVVDRGTVEVEVRHVQGTRYQYDVLVPNVVVTTAEAEGMEVRIGLSREGQAVQVYTNGHWEKQPVIQWTADPHGASHYMPRYMWDGERRMGRTLRSWAGRSKKRRSARRMQRRKGWTCWGKEGIERTCFRDGRRG